MKISKKQMLLAIVSLLVLLASLTVMLLDIFIPLDFWTHPVLNFLFCLCVGFGLISLVLGFINKSSWHFFISSILLGLALIYLLAQYMYFWIGLIIVACFLVVVCLLCFISSSNKTESIALNDRPDYKDYHQRKAEKEAKEESQELPEIKSFK